MVFLEGKTDFSWNMQNFFENVQQYIFGSPKNVLLVDFVSLEEAIQEDCLCFLGLQINL